MPVNGVMVLNSILDGIHLAIFSEQEGPGLRRVNPQDIPGLVRAPDPVTPAGPRHRPPGNGLERRSIVEMPLQVPFDLPDRSIPRAVEDHRRLGDWRAAVGAFRSRRVRFSGFRGGSRCGWFPHGAKLRWFGFGIGHQGPPLHRTIGNEDRRDRRGAHEGGQGSETQAPLPRVPCSRVPANFHGGSGSGFFGIAGRHGVSIGIADGKGVVMRDILI